MANFNSLASRFCNFIMAILGFVVFFKQSLQADNCGKVEVGPAFIHLDILESGHTIRTLDLMAVKADACFCVWNGISIKPTFLYGSNRGSVLSTGAVLGQYIPLTDCLAIMPGVGLNYSQIKTRVDVPTPFFVLENVREKFRSWAPYLNLDIYYNFTTNWRVCGYIQYAWSTTHTTLEDLFRAKSHCKGPNYGLMLEYDVNEKWSVNVGAAYNISLSKERHGIRATGLKVALAYWF